jgi:hypothetical protein
VKRGRAYYRFIKTPTSNPLKRIEPDFLFLENTMEGIGDSPMAG